MIRLFFILLIGIGCCSVFAAQAVVEPEDQPLTLTGTLKMAYGYGPPGYGLINSSKDQDMKISYWVLELPFEITLGCVRDNPDFVDTQCGPTKRLRLFYSASPDKSSFESKTKTLINHKVTVKGTLHRRTRMIEMTPVYMNVLDMAPKAKGG